MKIMKRRFYFKMLFIAVLTLGTYSGLSAHKFNKKLQNFCEAVVTESSLINPDRVSTLNDIANQILTDLNRFDVVQPLFICTHNSRRSHMAQLWLQTAAEFYGVEGIKPYSGGTEATAFNKNAVDALKRAGFDFSQVDVEGQLGYIVSTGSKGEERLMYSKKYDNKVNPGKDFFAVMVCSEADESCPLIPGADKRFALPYDDPRYFDDTPSYEIKYDETCRLISREMFYVMSEVKKQQNLEAEFKKK